MNDFATNTGLAPAPNLARRRAWPLRPPLALLLAGLATLLFAALLAVAHLLISNQQSAMALGRVDQRARTLSMEVSAGVLLATRQVQQLARTIDPARPTGDARTRADMEWIKGHGGPFVWLGLATPDGRVVVGTGGWLEGQSIESRPVFHEALRGTFVGDAHPAVALAPYLAGTADPKQELFDIGEPVRDASGRVVAVVVAHVGTAWIDRLRRRLSDPGIERMTGLQAWVLSGAPGRNLLPGDPPPAGLPGELTEAAAATANDGSRYFAASAGITSSNGRPALPWRVLVTQSRDSALAPGSNVVAAMALLGGVAALLIGVTGAMAARRMMRPWHPVFDELLQRANTADGPRSLAETIDELRHERAHRAPKAPLTEPEQLLGRIASDSRRLRRALDLLPFGVVITDAAWRIDFLSAGGTRLLGWTLPQIRGQMPGVGLLDPVEAVAFERMFDLFGDPPGEVVARFDARTPDGAKVPIQWHLIPLIDDSGRIEGSLVVITDIRTERAARGRAEAMAGRMRALASAAVDDLIATLDVDGRVLEWSHGAERLTGIPAARAMGQTFGELVRAKHRPPGGWREQALRHGRTTVGGWVRVADGRQRWFEGTLYALGLAPGAARFGLLLRDTTVQRETADRLAQNEARLRTAMDSARMGLWDITLGRDEEAHFHWSERYADAFGHAVDRLPTDSASFFAIIHPDDRDALREAVRRTIDDDAPFECQFRVVGAGGEIHWHAAYGRAMRNQSGQATRLIGVGLDVTARHLAEAERRTVETRLMRIIDTMAEGMMIRDTDGAVTLANRAALEIFGVTSAQIVGTRYDDAPWRRLDLDGRELAPGARPLDLTMRSPAGLRRMRLCVVRADGTRRIVSVNSQQLHDERGALVGSVAICDDITDAYRAEQALATSQARLAAVVDGAHDGIVGLRPDGCVVLFNAAAERIFHRPAASMQGRPLTDLLTPESGERLSSGLAAAAATGTSSRTPPVGNLQARRTDGVLLTLEVSMSRASVGDDPVITVVLRDISEREAQDRVLEAYRAELGHLTHRLLAQEKETSRRLAQALHDELGQTLTALRLHWDGLKDKAARVPDCVTPTGRIDALVDQAHRQVRSALNTLRPPLLDELGLTAALDNEIQRQAPHGEAIAVSLDVPQHLQSARWPADVEYAALMVAREALSNALSHAEAQHITVSVDGADDELTLAIQDDGQGLPIAARAGRPGHLGIVGMRERASAIGAMLYIDTPARGGTTVTLHWQRQP